MGISSSKTKTKNEPWAPAQPYILKGMDQTSRVFDENQPRLQNMSDMAYQGARNLAPQALSTSPYVSNAQAAAQTISNGYFLGQNPGQATYDRLQQPVYGAPKTSIGAGSNQPGSDALNRIAGGGSNPADGYASAVAGGQYLNAQPSANLYSTVMGADYLNGNPYLDAVIARTNADVTKDANRLFSSRGMGSGIGSAFADVMSKNLANNEGTLRYQNYNDAANRQLQAAGQSDAAWGNERGRMDASSALLASNYNAAQDRSLAAAQALGSQYGAGQDRALSAAQASDAAKESQVAQMLQALGMTGDLRNAEYAGVAPVTNLLNTAGSLPYTGVGALNENIKTASGGYGTSTTKTGMNLTQSLLDLAGKVISPR